MPLAIGLAILVGIAIVAQGAVNARLTQTSNLWLLLVIGNVFCAVASLIGWLATRAGGPWLQELGRVPPSVWIPSVAGFVITAGMPAAIGRIGVAGAVIVVIAVQIIASLALERFTSGQDPSLTRLAGAALVFIGSLLVVRG